MCTFHIITTLDKCMNLPKRDEHNVFLLRDGHVPSCFCSPKKNSVCLCRIIIVSDMMLFILKDKRVGICSSLFGILNKLTSHEL